MPLHRKPTHRLKVLAATLGVAGTVSGVAVAAQVGSESVGSAPETLTATSAPSSPLSSTARVPEDQGDRILRPTRGASTRRAPLPHRQARKPKASERPASPTTTTTKTPTDPVPGTDVTPSIAPSTRQAGRTPTPTTRSRTSGTSILEATNTARGSDGEAALGVDSCLQRMAQRHAERLASAGRLYHQDLGDVMRSCGMSTAGENVAMNYTGASDMVDQWLGSPGHRANLLSSRFSLIGIGVAQARDGAWYGVQVFGGR